MSAVSAPLVVALVNRKGGVAKTTSTLNLAYEAHVRGLRALCVDLDPQATLTMFAGYSPHDTPAEQQTLGALLPDKYAVDAAALTVDAPWGGRLWRASTALAEAEVELQQRLGPHRRLRDAIAEYAADVDVVFVDGPPSVGKLTLNALQAATHPVAPVEAAYAALGGFSVLQETLDTFRRFERADLQLAGVFATLVEHTNHSREAIEEFAARAGDAWLGVTIPKAVVVKDAAVQGLAVAQYDARHKAAVAYRDLADVLFARVGLRVLEGVS